MEQVFFIADFHLGDLMAYRGKTGENLRAFPGQFRSVELMMNKDPNLVSALTGHVEGSRAFTRYRTIDIDMKKDLVKILEGKQ